MRARLVLAVVTACMFVSAARAGGPSEEMHYDAKGHLAFPADYREWVFLSSSFDMSLAGEPAGTHVFDNIFVNPSAYRAFRETGTWPDKTVLVLETRGAIGKGLINKAEGYQGHSQGRAVTALEVHVRDSSRFKNNWAFFDFDKPEGVAFEMKHTAACYSCHQAHAAVDTTFAQFYPTLIGVAEQKGMLSARDLKEQAAPAPKP